MGQGAHAERPTGYQHEAQCFSWQRPGVAPQHAGSGERGSGIYTGYFVHSPSHFWVELGLLFGGWQHFHNYVLVWVDFSVMIRRTGISL